MNDQLLKNVESVVEEIFKKKEEAEMRQETEDALNKAAETITQLNSSLEAKDEAHIAEMAKLQESIASLESELSALKSTIEDSNKLLEDEKAKFEEYKTKSEEEKTSLTQKAESAEQELTNIKKDQLSASRMMDLESAGVASTDKDKQLAKIREMSAEEFDSYKVELVSIRESVVSQLQAAAADASNSAANDTVDNLTDAAVSVQPSIDTSSTSMASINMESDTSSDLLSKYKALGSQMAIDIKSEKK